MSEAKEGKSVTKFVFPESDLAAATLRQTLRPAERRLSGLQQAEAALVFAPLMSPELNLPCPSNARATSSSLSVQYQSLKMVDFTIRFCFFH
jgi:hypothetical protein